MQLIFATTNKHKIESAKLVLGKHGIEVVGKEIEVDEIQSNSPEAVIIDKVRKCYKKVKSPLIAMDSGLFIEPLGGFPGIYTKFIIESIGDTGIMKLAKKIKPCKAYVQRMIGYTDGKIVKIFSSRGYGEILQERRGVRGRNYDAIFYVPNKEKTLAELTQEERVEVWGDAWEKLALWLKQRFDIYSLRAQNT